MARALVLLAFFAVVGGMLLLAGVDASVRPDCPCLNEAPIACSACIQNITLEQMCKLIFQFNGIDKQNECAAFKTGSPSHRPSRRPSKQPSVFQARFPSKSPITLEEYNEYWDSYHQYEESASPSASPIRAGQTATPSSPTFSPVGPNSKKPTRVPTANPGTTSTSSPTVLQPPVESGNANASGSSSGTIAGLAVALVIVVLLIGFFFYRRRQKINRATNLAASNAPAPAVHEFGSGTSLYRVTKGKGPKDNEIALT